MPPFSKINRWKSLSSIAFFGGLFALLLTFYFTDLYLKRNFAYGGEGYWKGAGHLVKENFWKAILFLGSRHFLVSTNCFFLIFCLVGQENRKSLYNLLWYVVIIMLFILFLYTIYLLHKVATENYDGESRIIEITLTWSLRGVGLFSGYSLACALLGPSSPQKLAK